MDEFTYQEHCEQCPVRKRYEAIKAMYRENRRKYMAAHPEQREAHAAKQREYYAANKETIKAKNRKHYMANKEAYAAAHRKYYEANKEAYLAKRMEYYKKNHPTPRVCMSEMLRSEFEDALCHVDVDEFRAFVLSNHKGRLYDFDRNDAVFRASLSDGITAAAQKCGIGKERARQIMNRHAKYLREFIREQGLREEPNDE